MLTNYNIIVIHKIEKKALLLEVIGYRARASVTQRARNDNFST